MNIKLHDLVWFLCEVCNARVVRRWDYLKKRRNSGKKDTCSKCSNSAASIIKWANYSDEKSSRILGKLHSGLHIFNDKLSSEERSARGNNAGKLLRKKIKEGILDPTVWVRKQWETIKVDPEQFAALKKQRGETTKKIWAELSDEERSKRVANALKKRKVSVSGSVFLKILSKKGKIKVKKEVPISGFVVDGLHKESNTIILYHGDFWHCNPKKYKDPKLFCSWLGRTVEEQWLRDKRQLGIFYKLGYKVAIVWESDWNQNQDKELIRVLQIIKTP